MVAVLSLALGAGSPHSPVDAAKVTTISHAVATAHLVARPAAPDQTATPVALAALAIAFGFVLIRRRRVVPIRLNQGRSPSGRAPPGLSTHR
jgi:MYXO-CTERM domain-containing protein